MSGQKKKESFLVTQTEGNGQNKFLNIHSKQIKHMKTYKLKPGDVVFVLVGNSERPFRVVEYNKQTGYLFLGEIKTIRRKVESGKKSSSVISYSDKKGFVNRAGVREIVLKERGGFIDRGTVPANKKCFVNPVEGGKKTPVLPSATKTNQKGIVNSVDGGKKTPVLPSATNKRGIIRPTQSRETDRKVTGSTTPGVLSSTSQRVTVGSTDVTEIDKSTSGVAQSSDHCCFVRPVGVTTEKGNGDEDRKTW